MKKFSETTKEERLAMSDEEWFKVLPEEKRSCHDCKYLKAYVNWWCTNQNAIKDRGTAIPGICLCSHWELQPKKEVHKIKKKFWFNWFKRKKK